MKPLTKNIIIVYFVLSILAVIILIFLFKTTILCGFDKFHFSSIATSNNNLFAIEKQDTTTQILYLTDFSGNEKTISKRTHERRGFPYTCESAIPNGFNPHFSPDGSFLYYVTFEEGETDYYLGLHRYSVKNDYDEIIGAILRGSDVFDGKRLYFEDINKNNSIKLNSILKEYKTYDSVIRASSPSISVDGKTLIFIASNSSIIPENSTEYGVGSIVGTNEPDKLGILNMETNNISLIDISNLSNALYPFWSEPQISPDGKYVIWVQEPSSESGDPYVRVLGYFEIFKLDLQTNEITQITNLKSAIEHPVFMDNKTIVFLKDSDYKLEDQYGIRTNEIWTIDINGADLRRLLILRN